VFDITYLVYSIFCVLKIRFASGLPGCYQKSQGRTQDIYDRILLTASKIMANGYMKLNHVFVIVAIIEVNFVHALLCGEIIP
jgi:hypothetical protein